MRPRKAIVFGLLAVLIVLPAVVLLVVALFRVLTVIYQGDVWAAWLTLGGIFVLLGWFCGSSATRDPAPATGGAGSPRKVAK